MRSKGGGHAGRLRIGCHRAKKRVPHLWAHAALTVAKSINSSLLAACPSPCSSPVARCTFGSSSFPLHGLRDPPQSQVRFRRKTIVGREKRRKLQSVSKV